MTSLIRTPKFLLLSLVLFLAGVILTTANAGPVTHDVPVLTSLSATSAISYDLVNADFNGDGKLDAATVQFTTNTITIVYGDGAGKFSAPVTFNTPAGPHALIAVDYNGDLKPDLLTANTSANSFSLFINNGNGTFTDTSFPSGFAPTAVAVGDFNNDTRLDVATCSESANTVNISLANPGGAFNAPSFISLPNAVPKFLLSADFNGDGKPDLVTANAGPSSNNISVFIGDGMGGFSAPTNLATGVVNSSPSHISVGYFNADLNLDLIVTLTGIGKVAYFSGAGNGTFTLTTSFDVGFAGTTPVTTLIRDMNNDAKADLITASYGSDQLTISYGNGTGGISSQQNFVTARQPHTVAVGDFNGDGLLDLTTILDGSRTLALYLNRGPGSFPAPKFVSPIKGFVRTADFNRDGKPDLLLGEGAGQGVGNPSVLMGIGDGTFAAPVMVAGGGFNGGDVLVGDINSDGFPDLVIGSGTSNAVSVRLNNGSGGFTSVNNLNTVSGLLGSGDFNNDGKIDLLITDPSTQVNNLRFFLGDGLGGFVLTAGVTFAGTPLTLKVADLNSDNHPDLIVTRGGGFGIMLWTGPNTYSAPAYYMNGCAPGPFPSITGDTSSDYGPVALADFNRDGKIDILRGATQCGLLAGDGNGGFAPLGGDTSVPLSAGTVGDFDRNGIPDIALGPGDSGELRILYHDGAGHFNSTSYGTIRSYLRSVAADFNGDGIDDLVTINSAGLQGFTGTYITLSRPLARGLATADFDGDGRTDISVFRPSTGIWYIIRSSDNTFYGVQFGQNGDRPVPGDYDADGKTDIAVFRPAGGVWYILRSSDGSFLAQQHGTNGDIPVPADYNGDGATNIAVYRPSTGFWYTSTNPATNYDAVQFGAAGDIPTQADFDGDGRADVAVFRPSTGSWYSLRTTQGFHQISFGINGDRPAPLDYDGDGKANVAVFRPSNGFWYTSTNPATNFGAIQWGLATDVMAPGYYDGDARADVGVYRTGDWYVLNTATPTYNHFYFGAAGDIPIPLAFIPQ